MVRLVMFIGKPAHGDYQDIEYQFPDGSTFGPSKFFGKALFQWLETQQVEVTSVQILGSRNSIWHHTLELQTKHLHLASELEEAVLNEGVTDDDLERLQDCLSSQLEAHVLCEIVPTETSKDNLAQLVGTLGRSVEARTEIYVDVTHGFRHWGLIAVQALDFLRLAHGAQLKGVYYGNLQTKQAVDLALDRLMEWSEQLAILRNTGLFGQLPHLVSQHDDRLGSALHELDFALSTHRLGDVSTALKRVHSILASPSANVTNPILDLALDALGQELEVLTTDHIADVQIDLAERALETGDFLRCSLLLVEAVVSASIADSKKRSNPRLRIEASNQLKGRMQTHELDFKRLNHVRNAMAHGSDSKGEDILRDREQAALYFRKTLKKVRHAVTQLKSNPEI